ncbi:MAG: GTP-binding protein [Mangrovibacterium sp.]
MNKTKLIMVGGFLGAGKTTLLWQTAVQLMKQGLKVGLITNDQAPDLVDTKLLNLLDLPVAEVNGSCFCCNFDGFTSAIQHIKREIAADIILAEPVGSCTDLSATILQPIKKYWNRDIELLPLSVLIDPIRLKSLNKTTSLTLHPDASYILEKQLEESDFILLNKADTLTNSELVAIKHSVQARFPSSQVMALSAQTGLGVSDWINSLQTFSFSFAHKIVQVDYDRYAHGEAVLGWLNGTLGLSGGLTNWDDFLKMLMLCLGQQFDTDNLPVGHVKVFAETPENFALGNLTGGIETLSLRGTVGESTQVKLTINARVETSPENLNRIVRFAIQECSGEALRVTIESWRYMHPGRPTPTHRFEKAYQ